MVKKIPDLVKKHLDQNEECKELNGKGVFSKTHKIVTNKRLLIIKKTLL